MSKKVRIAVVSDLHAFDSRGKTVENQVSFLDIAKSESEHGSHPITGLFRLIRSNSLVADMLISPGDFSDKAAPVALKYVWEKLQTLGSELKARLIVPTAGNHDLDSRYQHSDFDAKGLLQSLVPSFPFSDDEASNKFWARNYVVVRFEGVRFLVLNSAAFHGNGSEEIQHGRVSTATVASIKAELGQDQGDYAVNILLCHHHPVKYNDSALDSSVMRGGDVLMELLNNGEYGSWMVVHGHKHSPNLFYSAGGGGSPVVFSAGSLSAVLYPELQTKARNQFHILELDFDEMRSMALGIAGTVYSWDWNEGIGWQQAGLRSGLPHICNFGNREGPASLAKQIEDALRDAAQPYLSWQELTKVLPRHKYILPADLQAVVRILDAKKIGVVWESNSCVIAEIGGKNV